MDENVDSTSDGVGYKLRSKYILRCVKDLIPVGERGLKKAFTGDSA